MTVEKSHGKPRVIGPRLRAVRPVEPGAKPPAERDAGGRFAHGNRIGAGARAAHALTAPLRALVAAAVGTTPSCSAATAATLATRALTLYRAGRRDLGTTSPVALSHLVRWASNTALAAHYVGVAAVAGLDTDRGLRLVELAHACEGRAERASLAAITLAGALGGRRAPVDRDAPWLEGDDP